MNIKKCPICTGEQPTFFATYCDKHDVCVSCGKHRSEITSTNWGSNEGAFKCNDCVKAAKKKAIDDFDKDSVDEYDFQLNDYIKCPNCGYEHHNPDEFYESGEFNCGECDSEFYVEVEHSMTYNVEFPQKKQGPNGK